MPCISLGSVFFCRLFASEKEIKVKSVITHIEMTRHTLIYEERKKKGFFFQVV